LLSTTGLNEALIRQKHTSNEGLTLQETEFLTELLRIESDYNNQMAANNLALEEADKTAKEKTAAQEKTNLETRVANEKLALEIKMARAATQYEQDVITEQMRFDEEKAKLDERKLQGLINEEQYNTLLEAEKKKHTNNTEAMDQAVADNKLELAAGTFSNLSAILGKESAAGKAIAVAQATIDTYKSAVSAYSALAGIAVVGPALGAIAAGAAVAAGIANVKKITATKSPKAEKGALFSIGGNRHSAGGTLFTGADGTSFEAEQGELIGVMNRNAAHHFMAFNNAFPAGGPSSPNYFAGGGIVSREIASPGLNTDELAAKLANANRALPAPVVAVQDIVTESNSYVRVRNGADF
jgi:hypothetical protein